MMARYLSSTGTDGGCCRIGDPFLLKCCWILQLHPHMQVRHDQTVTWLAFWKDTISDREYKVCCGGRSVCGGGGGQLLKVGEGSMSGGRALFKGEMQGGNFSAAPPAPHESSTAVHSELQSSSTPQTRCCACPSAARQREERGRSCA